ncbi:MAG: hypothetical protein ACRDM8_04480 [Gaiellaceae bacterium]
MPTITQVGAELAEVPFGDLIADVAQGIAEGQRALDLTSVQTLIELSKATVDLIPEVTEVITPEPFDVNVSGHAPISVTGARVTASASEPVQMSALQAGIVPSFYQFAEATIQLKMSLQIREVEKEESEGEKSRGKHLFGSHVNFRTQNTFTYTAEASSSVTAVIRPVPPPTRLVPSIVTVNALGPAPTVTIN